MMEESNDLSHLSPEELQARLDAIQREMAERFNSDNQEKVFKKINDGDNLLIQKEVNPPQEVYIPLIEEYEKGQIVRPLKSNNQGHISSNEYKQKKKISLETKLIIIAVCTIVCGFMALTIAILIKGDADSPQRPTRIAPTLTPTLDLISPSTSFIVKESLRIQVSEITTSSYIPGSTLEPDQDYYLILVLTVANSSSDEVCLNYKDFVLSLEPLSNTTYSLDASAMKAAKPAYKNIDYPGRWLGHCIKPNRTVKSLLVFDIYNSVRNEDIYLFMHGQKVRIGTSLAVKGLYPAPTPYPTLNSANIITSTPIASVTPTVIITPTITQTPTITPYFVTFAKSEETTVYSGPDYIYEIVRIITNEMIISIYGKDDTGQWLLINLNGGEWVPIDTVFNFTKIEQVPSIGTLTPTLTPTHTPSPTATATPTPTSTITSTPTLTPIPGINLDTIYRNSERMTALQYNEFKTSVIGQPIRQNVKLGNVDDKGRLILSGEWSGSIINWHDFCVIVAGVPTDIGLTLDGGQTIYLEATINRFDKYYFYNCDETLVLIYKRISK